MGNHPCKQLGLSEPTLKISPTDLRQLWDRYDADGDGNLTEGQLKSLLGHLASALGVTASDSSWRDEALSLIGRHLRSNRRSDDDPLASSDNLRSILENVRSGGMHSATDRSSIEVTFKEFLEMLQLKMSRCLEDDVQPIHSRQGTVSTSRTERQPSKEHRQSRNAGKIEDGMSREDSMKKLKHGSSRKLFTSRGGKGKKEKEERREEKEREKNKKKGSTGKGTHQELQRMAASNIGLDIDSGPKSNLKQASRPQWSAQINYRRRLILAQPLPNGELMQVPWLKEFQQSAAESQKSSENSFNLETQGSISDINELLTSGSSRGDMWGSSSSGRGQSLKTHSVGLEGKDLKRSESENYSKKISRGNGACSGSRRDGRRSVSPKHTSDSRVAGKTQIETKEKEPEAGKWDRHEPSKEKTEGVDVGIGRKSTKERDVEAVRTRERERRSADATTIEAQRALEAIRKKEAILKGAADSLKEKEELLNMPRKEPSSGSIIRRCIDKKPLPRNSQPQENFRARSEKTFERGPSYENSLKILGLQGKSLSANAADEVDEDCSTTNIDLSKSVSETADDGIECYSVEDDFSVNDRNNIPSATQTMEPGSRSDSSDRDQDVGEEDDVDSYQISDDMEPTVTPVEDTPPRKFPRNQSLKHTSEVLQPELPPSFKNVRRRSTLTNATRGGIEKEDADDDDDDVEAYGVAEDVSSYTTTSDQTDVVSYGAMEDDLDSVESYNVDDDIGSGKETENKGKINGGGGVGGGNGGDGNGDVDGDDDGDGDDVEAYGVESYGMDGNETGGDDDDITSYASAVPERSQSREISAPPRMIVTGQTREEHATEESHDRRKRNFASESLRPSLGLVAAMASHYSPVGKDRGKLKRSFRIQGETSSSESEEGDDGQKEEEEKENRKEKRASVNASIPQKEVKQIDIGDWNSRFQAIQSQLCLLMRSDNEAILESGLVDYQSINMELINLIQDFITTTMTYGRIIIQERYLDMNQKTIKPTSVGGQAGGEKYIVNKVLFKFAVDAHGMFNGSDYAAAKVAGHELNGLMAYHNCNIVELCLPLMALLDFNGFRLIAMSLIPVTKTTLCYGTADAGRTVECSGPFKQLMPLTAQVLNLKGHFCGKDVPSGKFLYAAADIEGHVGSDNRCYLLDFSRTFPPTTPDRNIFNGHLFQLFRPEYVKAYPEPLCPDAFSGFIRADPLRAQHNRAAARATDILLHSVIPGAVTQIEQTFTDSLRRGKLEKYHLSEHFHRFGINMRYVGVLLRRVDNRQLAAILLIEALARALKNDLLQKLREKQRDLKVTVSAPYRQLIIDFLNLVFGDPVFQGSKKWWEQIATKELPQKFYVESFTLPGVKEEVAHKFYTIPITTSPDLIPQDTSSLDPLDWRRLLLLMNEYIVNGSTVVTGRYILFVRLAKMMALDFMQTTYQKVRGSKYWHSEAPFEMLDLIEQCMKVKHTNMVTTATGNFYHSKALEAIKYASVEEAMAFIDVANNKFEEALLSDPTNPQVLLAYAQTCAKKLELERTGGRSMADCKFSIDDPDVTDVDLYFLWAIQASKKLSPKSQAYAVFLYARFLVKCQRLSRADDYFLRSLECDPNNLRCLRTYGRFLMDYFNNMTDSGWFLKRAEMIGRSAFQ